MSGRPSGTSPYRVRPAVPGTRLPCERWPLFPRNVVFSPFRLLARGTASYLRGRDARYDQIFELSRVGFPTTRRFRVDNPARGRCTSALFTARRHEASVPGHGATVSSARSVKVNVSRRPAHFRWIHVQRIALAQRETFSPRKTLWKCIGISFVAFRDFFNIIFYFRKII